MKTPEEILAFLERRKRVLNRELKVVAEQRQFALEQEHTHLASACQIVLNALKTRRDDLTTLVTYIRA